jgi:hypothetical protein
MANKTEASESTLCQVPYAYTHVPSYMNSDYQSIHNLSYIKSMSLSQLDGAPFSAQDHRA